MAVDCFENPEPVVVPPYGTRHLRCLGRSTPILIRNGSLDLHNRKWDDYEAGFEEADAYWLGNYILAPLTLNRLNAFRVDLWAADGSYRYAEFERIQLYPDNLQYALSLGDFTDRGRAGEGGLKSSHALKMFTTPDKTTQNPCGATWGAGWWFTAAPTCYTSMLTGNYSDMTWYTPDSWITPSNELTAVVMRMMPQSADGKEQF